MAEIGSTLREARMRARIDISEVEAETKIRAKYLRALENEEWDLLPGSVYVKSFLKTYASYLGLDSRLLVDEFRRRYERAEEHEPRPAAPAAAAGRREEERPARRSRQPAPPRRLRSATIFSPPVMIGVLLVVVVVALYAISRLGSGGSSGNGQSPALSSHQHHRTGAKGKRSRRTTSTTGTTPATTSRKARLTIVPTGDVYVCVERPDGAQLLADTYAVGETVPSVSGRTLLVTFGNANASLTVNGRPYALSASPDPIGLKVTAAGVKPLSPGPTCS